MRKIILNLAMSLDGYIADESGGYDWIVGDGDDALNHNAPYDFEKFIDTIDTMLMGRKAFEDCPLEPFKDLTIYVSTNKDMKEHDNVKFIKGDIVKQITDLKNQPGKDIYLFGGGVSIDPFIKSNVIDQYSVAIVPTILGKGRKLFLDDNPEIKLHLDGYVIEKGTTILQYSRR